MKKLYTALLALLVLTGCDHEDVPDAVEYPVSYILSTKTTSPKRLLTQQGEVTDPALVKAFSDKHTGTFFDPGFPKPDTITFISASQVEHRNFYGRTSYMVENKEGILLFKATLESEVTRDVFTKRLHQIENTISLYPQELYNERPNIPGPKNTFTFTTRRQMVASLQEGKLTLQYIRNLIKIKSTDTTQYPLYRHDISNKLNVNNLSLLDLTDSILVEEYVLTGQRIK